MFKYNTLQLLALTLVLGLSIYTNSITTSQSPLGIAKLILATLIIIIVVIFYLIKYQPLIVTPPKSKESFASDTGQPDYLKLIRFLAALVVFAMHQGIVLGVDFTHNNSSWAWIVYSPAWFGMSMFFTLSGYLMTKGFLTGRFHFSGTGAAKFIDTRIHRLLPLMLVVFLTFSGLETWHNFDLGTLGSIAIFAFNGKYGGSNGVGAFWSLSAEFHFYLIAPIVASIFASCLFKRHKLFLVFIACSSLGIFLRVFSGIIFRENGLNLWVKIWPSLYGHIDEFLFGGIACLVVTVHGKKLSLYKGLWPFILFAGYLLYSWIAFPVMSGSSMVDPLTKQLLINIFLYFGPSIGAFFSATCIVLIESNNPKKITHYPKNLILETCLTTIAGITFSFYLLHSFILVKIHQYLVNFPYFHQLVISLTLTLSLSYLSFAKIEPWLAKKVKIRIFENLSGKLSPH